MNIKLLFTTYSNYNLNLMKAFLKHYKKFGIEEIFCLYNELEGGNLDKRNYIEQNAKIVHVYSKQDTPNIKVELNNKYKREIASCEDDWIIHVNSDEFLDVDSDMLYNVSRSHANYVNATLVDHFSEQGLEIVKDNNPFKQFDVRATFTKEVLGADVYKIPITRAYVPIEINNNSVSNFVGNYKTERSLVPYNPNEDEHFFIAKFKWHADLLQDAHQESVNENNSSISISKQEKFLLDYTSNKKIMNELIENCRVRELYLGE